jgi:competence ComEA-like helix-hairpin-helix protein
MTRTKLTHRLGSLTHRLASLAGIGLLVAAMGGTWSPASAAPPWSPTRPSATATASSPSAAHAAAPAAASTPDDPGRSLKSSHHELTGKLNLNTATEDQLMLLPTVGPAKAERIVTWRKKNGGFRRTADLRHVKGFGYKTFKRLEPFLDIKGDSTLAAK